MTPDGVSKRRTRRIGLLGGTFDPVHIGHLVAAAEARDVLRLDEVLFVPAATPPHKLGVPMSPADHRLAMLELVVADKPAFATCRLDLDRAGPHYTVDLLSLAIRRFSLTESDNLWFIMGADSLVDLPTWRDPQGIISLARLAVASRPGHEPFLDELEDSIPGLSDRVDHVPIPLIGVSGTNIRRRVREGRTIAYHVPLAVEAYVHQHMLYQTS